jgi:hypothetical protein
MQVAHSSSSAALLRGAIGGAARSRGGRVASFNAFHKQHQRLGDLHSGHRPQVAVGGEIVKSSDFCLEFGLHFLVDLQLTFEPRLVMFLDREELTGITPRICHSACHHGCALRPRWLLAAALLMMSCELLERPSACVPPLITWFHECKFPATHPNLRATRPRVSY